jgi:hypothetical protein
MILEIKRTIFTDVVTHGDLFINGKLFCHTLEPKYRHLNQFMSIDAIDKIKVKGKTAIPSGRYKMILSYSPKFNRILPELIDVVGFKNIRIHELNFAHETEGCIGLGYQQTINSIWQSRLAVDHFIKYINSSGETDLNILIR